KRRDFQEAFAVVLELLPDLIVVRRGGHREYFAGQPVEIIRFVKLSARKRTEQVLPRNFNTVNRSHQVSPLFLLTFYSVSKHNLRHASNIYSRCPPRVAGRCQLSPAASFPSRVG